MQKCTVYVRRGTSFPHYVFINIPQKRQEEIVCKKAKIKKDRLHYYMPFRDIFVFSKKKRSIKK